MAKARACAAFGASVLLAMNSLSAKAADEIQLDGIVVTTSKTAESAVDTLAGSSAIGREQMEQQFQPSSITEVLDTIPGVITQTNGHDPGVAVNIRGLQDFGRVNVLIDGARQNFQRSGHAANGVFYLEPEMLKSVDITRGPTSVIYGSGAIGGVVAFETLSADDILRPGEYAAVQSHSTYDTNGNGKMESGTAAVSAGWFDVLVQGTGRWSDDYKDGDGKTVPDSGNTTTSNLVKARIRPGEGQQITGTFIDYDSTFVDNLDGVERDSDLGNRQYTLGYTFARPDTPLIDFSAKIYRNTTDLDQTRTTFSPFEPIGSERHFGIVTDGFDIFNTSRFSFSNVKMALTYGGDAFRDQVDTSDPNGDGDEFTPSGQRIVSGAFVQNQLTFFEIFDLIAAVRYDSYSLEGGNVSLDGSRVSPKVTAGLTPIPGLTVYSTYAEGYRAPAVTETLIEGIHPQPAPFPLLPNPNLRPEVAHNVEGGVNLKYDNILTSNDAFRAKFAVYQNKVDDYIDGVAFFDPTSPLGFAFQYQNIANATIRGAEFEASYDAHAWFAAFSASRIRGENDDTGEGLLSIPADQITVTAGFRAFEEKLVAGTRARFVASQTRIPQFDVEGNPFVPGEAYTVVDLFASYQATENTSLNLNLNNLLDETYEVYRDTENSPGFNARLGVTMRLGAN